MVVPINPLNPKGAQPKGKAQRGNSTSGAGFANTFKNAAKDIYQKVPEALAPYKDDLRKRKLSEERNWQNKDKEEEDSVDSLVQKIEQRLKRLAKLTEDEKKNE